MALAPGMLSDESAVSVTVNYRVSCDELWRALTNDDVSVGSGFLYDRSIVEGAVGEFDIRILSFDRFSTLLISDKKGVVVVGMGVVNRIKRRSSNVAFSFH